jgi:hypothetical protein
MNSPCARPRRSRDPRPPITALMIQPKSRRRARPESPVAQSSSRCAIFYALRSRCSRRRADAVEYHYWDEISGWQLTGWCQLEGSYGRDDPALLISLTFSAAFRSYRTTLGNNDLTTPGQRKKLSSKSVYSGQKGQCYPVRLDPCPVTVGNACIAICSTIIFLELSHSTMRRLSQSHFTVLTRSSICTSLFWIHLWPVRVPVPDNSTRATWSPFLPADSLWSEFVGYAPLLVLEICDAQ